MAKFDIFRRARGYVGDSDYRRVGTVEADSAEEADKIWWERYPDYTGLVVGQWAKEREEEEEEEEETEPTVTASDYEYMSYSEARKLWEGGEFSDWVETHGLPLQIGDEVIHNIEDVEEALSDDQWD